MSDKEQLLDLESKPLTSWKKEPTIRELKQDYEDARSYHDAQVSKIDTWLDNLNCTGSAKIKPVAGHSSVQPMLIRKQAEWRYAALSEPFLSTEDVFNVTPVTFEDKEAAAQNQLVLNHQFNNVINKVSLFDEYVRAVVDEGTVIAKVGWEFEEEEVEEEVPIIEFSINPEMEEVHAELAEMKKWNPQDYEALPEELKQAHEMTMEEGQPIEGIVVGVETQKVMKTLVNKPTVEICDYRNVVIDPTANGDIDKAGFVIYSFESSLSVLEKDKRYKNLKNINLEGSSILGEPDHATTTLESRSFNFKDKPRKKFVVREYWGFRDIDDTGLVKPFVASWVGNTLIRMEENPFPDKKLPFVVVPYLPVRGEMYGEPDGALLVDNQKIIGAVTRGMIDIMGKSANGQMGVRKDALDLTNKRRFEANKQYEFNANVDPRQAFYMHTYPEIPQSAQFMLQLNNMEAESITGVKSFSQGVSGASLGDEIGRAHV